MKVQEFNTKEIKMLWYNLNVPSLLFVNVCEVCVAISVPVPLLTKIFFHKLESWHTNHQVLFIVIK